jgi:hypothetical protein
MTSDSIRFIRETATKLVAGLTTNPITDYQITFIAVQAKVLRHYVLYLEELSSNDLENLYHWIKLERYRQIINQGRTK